MALLFQIQNAFIISLILVGIYFRKKRNLHVPIMLSAISWDLLLVLQIEFNRDAIAKALEFKTTLLNIHISLAFLTGIFYIGMIYTGRKLLHKDESFRYLHKRLAFITICLRASVLITSYWIV